MDTSLCSELLFLRARWRRRDHWARVVSPPIKKRALGDLRRAADAASELYRHHHAGALRPTLVRLPPVTKANLQVVAAVERTPLGKTPLSGAEGAAMTAKKMCNLADDLANAPWRALQGTT